MTFWTQVIAGIVGLVSVIGIVAGALLQAFNSGKKAQQNADLKEQVRVDQKVDSAVDAAQKAGDDRRRSDSAGGLRDDDGYRRD